MSEFAPLFAFDVKLLAQRGLESLRELVGTGGAVAALESFTGGDDVLDLAALGQRGHALGVAAAAADKLDVLDDAVLNVDIDLLGAGPVRLVFQFHN